MDMPLVRTSIHTTDGSATTTPGIVYGVLISAAATGGAWQLNDSADDLGTDLVSGVVGANQGYYMDLSGAPVQFNLGIRVDLPGSNQTITVFFTS